MSELLSQEQIDEIEQKERSPEDEMDMACLLDHIIELAAANLRVHEEAGGAQERVMHLEEYVTEQAGTIEGLRKMIGDGYGLPILPGVIFPRKDDARAAQNLWDNCGDAEKRITELEGLLREAHEVIDVPDRNCSCHLSPPCEDCVEWSGFREWLASVDEALGLNVPKSTEEKQDV